MDLSKMTIAVCDKSDLSANFKKAAIEMTIAKELERIYEGQDSGPPSDAVADFIYSWLAAEVEGVDAQNVWAYLIEKCPAENVPDRLYRGCRRVQNGRIESYSPKHDVATKFAAREGFLVIADKECVFNFTSCRAFDFTGLLSRLYPKIQGKKEYCDLQDAVEMWMHEDEYFLRTDVENFCVYKSVSKPAWLLEE